jgi:hypothetical protein
MPFKGYGQTFDNFNACLIHMQNKENYSEEVAKKICGKLQAESERKHSDNHQMRELRAKISFGQYQATDGGLLIKDVKLLASGTWTDSHMGTPLFYPESVLEKYASNWVDNSLWSRHGGGIPRSITEKIGEIRNPRYNGGAVIGDLWLHEKTQTSRDTAELIKAGLVDYVSVEHGGKERWNAQEKRYDAEEIIFGGVAVVNKGACKVCTIHNESEMKEGDTITELEALDIEMRVLAAGCRDPDLPASAYAWVEDSEKKTTWHLPYKGMDGTVKCQCVRAAIAAIGGARTGTPMAGVPDSAKSKLRSAAKGCNIETEFEQILHSWHDNEPSKTELINNGVDIKNMSENKSAADPKGTAAEKEAELRALQAQVSESKKSDLQALEAQLEEAKKNISHNLSAQLAGAGQKIAELEMENKELLRKLHDFEHNSKIKELQAEIAKLSAEPVYLTKVASAGAGVPARELELDNEEFPAFTAKDFGE